MKKIKRNWIPASAGMTALSIWLAGQFALPPNTLGQNPPDLKKQDAWGNPEKEAFLKYLRSNQSMPATGTVKDISGPAEEIARPHKARYLTLGLVSETAFTVSGTNVSAQSTNFGPKLIAGGHLFSWVRYFTGLQYVRMSQLKTNGDKASLAHYQIPFEMELALIPLGTPQTRYIVLRGGATAHYFGNSSAQKSDFATPLLGLHPSWSMGLGYEWQIPDTRWRLHALAQGYRSLDRPNQPRFFGFGLNAGVAYTL